MSECLIERGATFIGYPEERLARRHLITVKRVAKDGSWADIHVSTWAVAWNKRQPLFDGDFRFPHETFGGSVADWYVAQQADHERMLFDERR